MIGRTSMGSLWVENNAAGLTLKTYQLTGAVWVRNPTLGETRSGISADEKGLGGMVQVLTALTIVHNARKAYTVQDPTTTSLKLNAMFGPQLPALIVAPLHMLKDWSNTIETYFPMLKVITITSKDKAKYLHRGLPIFQPSLRSMETVKGPDSTNQAAPLPHINQHLT